MYFLLFAYFLIKKSKSDVFLVFLSKKSMFYAKKNKIKLEIASAIMYNILLYVLIRVK